MPYQVVELYLPAWAAPAGSIKTGLLLPDACGGCNWLSACAMRDTWRALVILVLDCGLCWFPHLDGVVHAV